MAVSCRNLSLYSNACPIVYKGIDKGGDKFNGTLHCISRLIPGVICFMSVIDIHRAHSLDKSHAREAAETLAKDLSRQFDVNYEWEGDRLRFKRSGIKGKLEISEQELHIHLELGLMLRPFKSRIEQEIHSQLDQITGA
jgi:putative polyhydroxyalkanoate system protein